MFSGGWADVAGDVHVHCDCRAVQRGPALAVVGLGGVGGYGMARLGLFGGGGGISSESGSAACFRFWAWTA